MSQLTHPRRAERVSGGLGSGMLGKPPTNPSVNEDHTHLPPRPSNTDLNDGHLRAELCGLACVCILSLTRTNHGGKQPWLQTIAAVPPTHAFLCPPGHPPSGTGRRSAVPDRSRDPVL